MGAHKLMLEARRGAWWDANKIGLCTPPIETERGWLVVYHGVKTTAAGSLYRLGVALFDLEAPETCLRRGDKWVMGPVTEHERVGDVGNVVFPCGLLPDGDSLRLSYGGADHCIALPLPRRAFAGCWNGSKRTDEMQHNQQTTSRR